MDIDTFEDYFSAVDDNRQSAKTIVEQGGDYLLAVKQNQGKLANAITAAFSEQHRTFNDDAVFEHSHGRIESRQCYVLDK
ncbi:hypothetical protein BGL48_02925 [Salinivibrio sp. SS3]|nr:hypothetical protein BGL48_02925 [Salinivibrio sp. BNH]